MKICAIICELNPFHNGHRYLIEQAKALSGCDFILCIMSGCFTQRGEICVADKFDRARHAVLGGADCVIELPTIFAVAPADVFAKGAIKILTQIPEVVMLAFGCESGSKEDFYQHAKLALEESVQFKKILSKNLAEGESYIRSYAAAFEAEGGKKEFFKQPNNILGLEYTKAILRAGAAIDILPIRRIGANHDDNQLKDDLSSASAIRNNLSSPLIAKNVPDFVFKDLKDNASAQKIFKETMRYELFRANISFMRKIYGCSEGLENRLKKFAFLPFDQLVSLATSKRYSSARIQRILCANLLKLYKNDSAEYLNEELDISLLAVNKECTDVIFPIIDKKTDNLHASKCKDCDRNAYRLWRFFNGLSDKAEYTAIISNDSNENR